VNNALVPFRDWNDIEGYLRQQWAGMLHAFLTSQNTVRQVTDTLEMLEDMNRQIEVLSTQILKSVGTESAKATARMYAKLLESRAMDDLKDIGANPTPSQVILNETFDDFAASIGVPWHPPEDPETSISSVGEISGERHRGSSTDYTRLRNELLDLLTEAGMSAEQLVAQERNDFSSASSRRSRKSGPHTVPLGAELSLLDK
jgi:hypothetical protein